ncbi:RNA 2',3'-cyclic phosphodiesterase [Bowmanella sp. Y26]|uniref:RNA 2',3'-cyclic phosphodiesterase n=1 Tax=Bowmanella yangjiangensis TaxID=2811230 RepID=UPI001BDDB85F|nr:RNA 2',3'-cyclic phosphodiesterase [Bowmanella yangjiangensis]MBT1061976.1 RNA 2',3'-cyclic phosphodiesterase [Bowmanella yangjiangensis]
MRLFFALALSGQDKLKIDEWRNKMLPALPHPVTTTNLHITLAFLGEIPNSTLETLTELAAKIQGVPFCMQINQTGYFPKPKVYWIGPSQHPPALTELVEQLRQRLRSAGLPAERRPLQAHISLFRKQSINPPAPLCAPDLALQFNSFSLFESKSGSKGVQYEELQRWPLTNRGSVRERLRKGQF